tara:strand:- start:149 stop:358 length:210 start_codon:yes stop_codon:yes gene_type:complete
MAINKQTKLKLTSVKVIDSLYNDFKHASLDQDLNLQKLVNRSITLYIEDKDFRKKINHFADLEESGSSF